MNSASISVTFTLPLRDPMFSCFCVGPVDNFQHGGRRVRGTEGRVRAALAAALAAALLASAELPRVALDAHADAYSCRRDGPREQRSARVYTRPKLARDRRCANA